MKARSVVFTHIQRPTTVFGLPPRMVGAAVGVSCVIFMVTMALGLTGIGVIVLLASLAANLWVVFRIGRSDPHIEQIFLTSFAFWRGSSRRWLLAGSPSPRSLREGRP